MSSASGQERKVICRACDFDFEILLKNYERHLARFHPSENCKDPRGKLDRSTVTIKQLFWGQKKRKLEEALDGAAAEDVSQKPSGDSGLGVPERDQDTDPEPDVSVRASLSQKPRHPSGDSGLGVLEPDQDTDPEPEASGSLFLRNDCDIDSLQSGSHKVESASQVEPEPVKASQAEGASSSPKPTTEQFREGDGACNEDILRKVMLNQASIEKVLHNQDMILKRLCDTNADTPAVSFPQSQSSVKMCQGKQTCYEKLEEVEEAGDKSESVGGPDLRNVTSVKELEQFGFKHNEHKSLLECVVCEAEFKYDGQKIINKEIHPREFRNLKSHLKSHFSTKKHLEKQEEQRKETEEKKYLVSRDQKAGKNLTRAAYSVIKSRNSEKQFETEVYLIHKSGGEVGNLNHSKHFIPKIRPYLATVVRKLKCQFLTTTLPQTGFPPPVAFTADGATYKR